MKTEDYKTTPDERLEANLRSALRSLGYKLTKKGDGYGTLVYNENVGCYIDCDGMWPVRHSLTLDDVIELLEEYRRDAQISG